MPDRPFSVALFLLLAPCAPANHVTAAEPKTQQPSVPALIVGSSPPRSFVVAGVMRFSRTDGLAFRVATDGRKELCALYDATDGTPLFLSDGYQSLVYDLSNARVVRVPNSRGSVRVDWNAKADTPLEFSFTVVANQLSAPKALGEANAWFRIDRFVEASGAALKRLDRSRNTALFAVERRTAVESLQTNPRDASGFRFTSRDKELGFYRLELEASHIGQQPLDAALAFPDAKALARDVAVAELDTQALAAFLVLLRDGRAWMAKLVFAGGGKMDELKQALPGADWNELRRRDAELGGRYRAALARQGVRFPLYKADAIAQH